MAPRILQILCVALVAGSLVGAGLCHGLNVDRGRSMLQTSATASATSSASSSGGKSATASSQATATSTGGKNTSSAVTATSIDGENSVTVTTTDGDETETATSTSTGGTAEATTGTGGSSGTGTATSTASRRSGSRGSTKDKIFGMLYEIIADIYITVAERVADNGDPELAARALVESRSFEIAAVWKSVINLDGRRGRGRACQDSDEFVEAQKAEFVDALVEAFELVKGVPLSDGAIEDIEDTIDTLMDQASVMQ